MRALFAIAVVVVAGCGGLENAPLTKGVLVGQLREPDALAIVTVIGQPEFTVRPARDGAFRIEGLPQGPIDLLVVIDGGRAERRALMMTGGGLIELGLVEGKAAARVKISVDASEHLPTAGGVARLEGTPLSVLLDGSGEGRFVLAAGCYQVVTEVPGLLATKQDFCTNEGADDELKILVPEPDGSPGNEGCLVAGCDDGAECLSTGACR